MGFSFYICNRCGQIHCESDLGAHQTNCQRKKASKEYKKELKRAIKNEFDIHYVNEVHLSWFHTFWDAVDYWKDNYKDEKKNNTEEYTRNLRLIKNFLYGPKYKDQEFYTMKQSDRDIAEARKIGYPTNAYEMQLETGHKIFS